MSGSVHNLHQPDRAFQAKYWPPPDWLPLLRDDRRLDDADLLLRRRERLEGLSPGGLLLVQQLLEQNARLFVENIVNNHIHNSLPIYMLYLPDMRLVHRSAVKQLILPAIDDMVSTYLNMNTTGIIQVGDHIQQMVKDKTAYGIFSHRWLVEGELTFQDVSKLESINAVGLRRLIKSPNDKLKDLRGTTILHRAMVFSGEENLNRNGKEVFEMMKEICQYMDPHTSDFVKLVKFCETALRCECDYVWLDTGCINRHSSTELEESIRAMFSWYRNSKICIVHLNETTAPFNMQHDAWFSRGWTLQELLAPTAIKFFSRSWGPLTPNQNDKVADEEIGVLLWEFISRITGIPQDQLLHFEPGIRDVRERMVWASRRKTTRVEDMAYCLIGIFNVPLSIAYGEGQMAFYRLQLEIMQRSHDRGLFVWNGAPSSLNSMFAAGPEAFSSLEGISLLIAGDGVAGSADPTYALTNYGLRIPLSIYDVRHIKNLGEQNEGWMGYTLKVSELGKIEVVLRPRITNEKLTVGILGDISDHKSLAIILISSESGSRRRLYKRAAMKDVIELSRPEKVKMPEMIFIV